ncbi:hypothetical protein Tco_0490565 [Tanacetum coccineum]
MVNDKGPKDGAVGSGKVTNSPYYLGSNDNPSNIITQKFGFIDETIKQPTEVYELEDWWTVQSMLVSWIMNIIKPSLRTRISYVEEASALWKDIKESCFDINGYPEWWGDRPKFEGKGKGTMPQQQKLNPSGGRGRGGQPHANATLVSMPWS